MRGNPDCIYRFGAFEYNERSGELRKNGLRVRLQDQSRQVLAKLVAHPGELVSRQELRTLIWPKDTFVDFETGLNTIIKRLRETLGDSAENPTFIETVPRQGYKFVASMEWTSHVAGGGSQPTPVSMTIVTPATAAVKSGPWPRRIIGTSVIAGLVCLSLGLYFYRPERTSHPTLAEFTITPFTTLLGMERSPTFSPDGSEIAFAWNGSTKKESAGRGFDIYLKATGSESLIQLTHHPADAISLSWSPDGAQIAFQRLAESESGVYLVPALGGAERRLRLTRAKPRGLSWSPDGQWIAFTDSVIASGNQTVNLISADSLETKSIPHMAECQEETFPTFSPDGKRLAYFCISQPGRFALYDVDPAGRTPHLIGRYAGWGGGIAWSRDKQKLVVARHVEGNKFSELDEITVSDGQLRKLPFSETGDSPAVSTRADKLTFETWHYAGIDIWRRSLIPRGAAAEKIIASTQFSWLPSYSPAGKHIVFMSNRTGTDEIWMSNADGTGLVQISKLNYSGAPRWSPDGRRIVFDSRSEGRPGVYIADIEERVPRRLRTNIEEISQPFWSHDGKWIYFIAGAHSGRISRCPAEGGEAEVLSSQAGSFPQESFAGDQVYFVANVTGNPTLMVISLKKPGSESMVEGIPSVNLVNWAVVTKGIYFLPNTKRSLEYFDFAAKKVSHLMELSDEPVRGLSVSQDQQSIVYGRLQQVDSDIAVVENWH